MSVKPFYAMFRSMTSRMHTGWVSLLFCMLCGSLAVSGAVFLKGVTRDMGMDVMAGLLLYISLIVAGGYGLVRLERLFGMNRAVGCLAVVSLSVKALILLAFSDIIQAGDRASFHQAVSGLVAGDWGPSVVAQLSAHDYDFKAWVSRSLALPVWLNLLVGSSDVLGIQIANAIFSTVEVILVFGIGRVLFSPRKALVASWLFAVSPIQYWKVLNYTFENIAMCFFLFGIYLAVRLWTQPQGRRAWLFSTGLGSSFFLAGLQGGLDLVGWLVLFSVWGIYSLQGGVSAKTTWCRFFWILVLPLAFSLPLKTYVAKWIKSIDVAAINSGGVAFMARGWNPTTGGEYDLAAEQMDRFTPIMSDKKKTMSTLVLSRIRYESVTIFGKLLPVKGLKYFLIGSASGIEENLRASGHKRVVPCVRSIRQMYAVFFLILAAMGCLVLLARPPDAGLTLCFLLPVFFCLAAVFLGETSPRYSLYVQPFLALLASHGVIKFGDVAGAVSGVVRRLTHGAVFWLVIYLAGAGIAVASVRLLPTQTFFRPLHAVEGKGAVLSKDGLTCRLAVGEQRIVFPVMDSKACNLVFFVWPETSEPNCRLTISAQGREVWAGNLSRLYPVTRIASPLVPSNRKIDLHFRLDQEKGSKSCVTWGFVDCSYAP